MSDNLKLLLEQNCLKLSRSIAVYLAIANEAPQYNKDYPYTAKELEKFDALTGRFLRVYETAIQFFRTVDLIASIEKADTYRDLIHHVCKLAYIKNEETWMEMRIIRNKITHDYLPDQFSEMYETICNSFTPEINYLHTKLEILE